MTKKIIIVFVIFAISFVSGVYFGIKYFGDKPELRAKVTFINNASKYIKVIDIMTSDSSRYVVKNLSVNRSRDVFITVYGESGYTAKIYFDNGDTLKCGAYIESGYSIIENITDQQVATNTKF